MAKPPPSLRASAGVSLVAVVVSLGMAGLLALVGATQFGQPSAAPARS